MTIELFLLSVVISAVVFTIADYTLRKLRRRREVRERAEALELADRFMARMFGVIRGEEVAPDAIKNGDQILWWSTDGQQHEHYTAGFDGDPGPSADGKHVRPIHQGEQK